MSGYYDRVHDDLCYRDFEKYIDDQTLDYNLNLKAHMRENVDKCHPLSTGKQCNFYGPLRGVRTTQESFMSGRGQVLSECPSCGVNYLPESLFPDKADPADFATVDQKNGMIRARCQRTDLEPLYTRQPRSCNGLSETDITAYSFMPSAWQRGYEGFRAVVDTNLQTRQALEDTSVTDGGLAYSQCRSSYGSYGSGRPFARYA